MDYREQAKDLLLHRNEYITARESLQNEIDMLKSEKYNASSSALSDTTTRKGGSSRYEEHLINLITMIDDATFRKQIVERRLKQISAGMDVLNDYEKELLNAYFVYKIKAPAEHFMEKRKIDATQVRIDKLSALEKFTRGVYGIVQL